MNLLSSYNLKAFLSNLENLLKEDSLKGEGKHI